MKYDPKDANQLIPAGIYSASIKSTSEQDKDGYPLVSKGGEPMQLVVFEVYLDHDTVRPYFQRFTAKSMLWLYRELAHALGAKQDFSDGKFDAADYHGSALKIEFDVKTSKDYGEQNRIVGFSSASPTGLPAAKASKPAADDQDVPF